MNFSVQTIVHNTDFTSKLIGASQQAVFDVAEKALGDSNYYCRQDQGTLIASSLYWSDLDNGVLRWHMPYAKKVYYIGVPSLDVNPNASLMWAHKAHEVHGEEWKSTFENTLRIYLRR